MFFSRNKQPKGTTITLNITGMHCTSCSILIDDAVESIPGVYRSDTSYAHATATVLYDPEKTDTETIRQAIKRAGYSLG